MDSFKHNQEKWRDPRNWSYKSFGVVCDFGPMVILTMSCCARESVTVTQWHVHQGWWLCIPPTKVDGWGDRLSGNVQSQVGLKSSVYIIGLSMQGDRILFAILLSQKLVTNCTNFASKCIPKGGEHSFPLDASSVSLMGKGYCKICPSHGTLWMPCCCGHLV